MATPLTYLRFGPEGRGKDRFGDKAHHPPNREPVVDERRTDGSIPGMLTALTEPGEIQRAFLAFRSTMWKGTIAENRTVGFQGGNVPSEVRWLKDEGYWCSLSETGHRDRGQHWNAFGLTPRSTARDPLSITAEINSPRSGINRRCGGVYAQDASGTVYLLHSGKLGGGKQGIGQANFLSFLDSPNLHEVAWADGKVTQAILIGRVDQRSIRGRVRGFLQQVQAFKRGEPALIPQAKGGGGNGYFDEFAGPRKPYSVSGTIEATCDHGRVIRSLYRLMRSKGIETLEKDVARDLFVRRGRDVVALFEAKTDCSPQSIYKAVGQLMVHTADCSLPPIRVLVVPKRPNSELMGRLANLGVVVVTYTLNKAGDRFGNIEPVLRELRSKRVARQTPGGRS